MTPFSLFCTLALIRRMFAPCVCVCVCDIIKMAKQRPLGRWRRQQFRGDSRESCAFSADGRSCTRTRHTQSQRYSSPSATGAAFVVGPTPIPSRPAILLPRWTSTRPHHPTTTPPGVPRAGSRVSSGYGGQFTRRASTACFTAMVPSCLSL